MVSKYLLLLLLSLSSINATELSISTPKPTTSYQDSTMTTTTVEVFYAVTMAEVCMVWNIAPQNCSCEKIDFLCEFSQYANEKGQFGVEHGVKPKAKGLTMFVTDGYIVAAITTVAMVIGVIGNSAILLISYQEWQILPRCKVLIAHLAFIDLLSSIINFLSTMHYFWGAMKWLLGAIMCKVLFSCVFVSSLLSVGYILIIAAERYFGIIHSMRAESRCGSKVVYSCVVLNFIVAFASAVPKFIIHKIDGNTGQCKEEWPSNRGMIEEWPSNRTIDTLKNKTSTNQTYPIYPITYQSCLLLLFMLIPVLIVSIIYIKILNFLRKDTKASVALNRDDIKKKREESNYRTMKLVMCIMITFVLCVLPTRITELYLAINGVHINPLLYRMLAVFVNVTYPLHACVNPIVYTAVDPKWRAKLLKTVCRRHQDRQQCESSVNRTRYTSVNGEDGSQWTV